MSRKRIFYSDEKAFKTLKCLCETFQNIRDVLSKLTLAAQKWHLGDLPPPKWPKRGEDVCSNIFWSMRRMTTRVGALESSDVNGCSKYTEHVRLTYRKTFVSHWSWRVHRKIVGDRFNLFSFQHNYLKSLSQRLAIRKNIYLALLVVVWTSVNVC